MQLILKLFKDHADSDYIGEPVSIIAHSLQAGYLASQSERADDELILGSLFHDVGHVVAAKMTADKDPNTPESMDGCGARDHEHLGAGYLKNLGFSFRV